MRPAYRFAQAVRPLVIVLCTLLTMTWLSPVSAEVVAVEVGPLTVEYQPRPGGMAIRWDGVSVSRHSGLVVTTPPWAPHFYVGPTEQAVAGATQSQADGATTLEIIHQGTDAFVGHERLTLSPSGTLVQDFEGRFELEDAEALVQWRAAALNPSLLMGMRFRAHAADGTITDGVFPVTPQPEEPPIARGFRRLVIETRLGPMSIEVESDQPLVLYDHRASRWSNPEDPYFWFGDLGTRIRADQPVKYRITYTFPPAIKSAENKPVEFSLPVARHADAQVSRLDGAPRIVPRPKEIRLAEGSVMVSHLPQPDEASGQQPWRLAEQKLLRHWRTLAAGVQEGRQPDARLRFRLAAADDAVQPEGYVLNIDADGIDIAAADTNGFLYAVQTLKQLSWHNGAGQIEVRNAQIRDWPALAFRGVHIFTGGKGPQLHEKLLRDVLAASKFNHVVLESEYIKWDAYPKIHHPEFGMDKADVRRILEVCRSLGIEVTPLVQSLGHCQWMFVNDENLDLAEDPEARYAYCVTNPKTYDFIFTVFQEALDLFEPRAFHIGHDEYTDRGRVPYREESKKFTVEELFMQDTLKLHGWLKERGVKVMMWGDMLLAKGEAPDACHAKSRESAQSLREQLPSDIIITDWHYAAEPPERFTSLGVFQDRGHPTIAATWYRPGNIVGFAHAAHQQKSLGLLQTTWAGYSLDPESFARETHQYIAHVLAGEAAWNADRAVSLDLLDAGEAFFEMMGMSALTRETRPGWCADLSPAGNACLTAKSNDGWFGLGPAHDLSAVPAGERRWRGVRFQIAPHDQDNVLALASRLSRGQSLPDRAALKLDADAAALALVVTTEFPSTTGTKIATAVARFADGTQAQLDLVYGHNLLACTDLTPAAQAPVLWRGRTPAGQPVALRATLWHFTDSNRLVDLELITCDSDASLVLIAATGLMPPP